MTNKKTIAVFSIISVTAALITVTIGRNASLMHVARRIAGLDLPFIIKTAAVLFLCCALNAVFFIAGRIYQKKDRKKLLTISYVLFFAGLFLFLFAVWCRKEYPIDEPGTVFFVLCSPLNGTQKGFLKNTCLFVLLPAALITAVTILFIKKSRKNTENRKRSFFCFALYFFVFSSLLFSVAFKLPDYIPLLIEYRKPAEFSEFWDKNFIEPRISAVKFPEKKRNLILIFLESMESSFTNPQNGGLLESDHIPLLAQIAEENINFSHHREQLGGGLDLANTDWTIAALVAKMAGFPQNLSADANPTKLPFFMPKAVFLTDILEENGYRMLFICGSDKAFASRDRMFYDHGNAEIKDFYWYRENGFLPSADYDNNFWGFEDKYLYNFAKTEITALAQDTQPFFFSMLTVDTHMSNGFICSECTETAGDRTQIETAIRCADRQIYDFILWCRKQNWYENTTIVIAGDHCFMVTDSSKELFGDRDTSGRRWIDIFINSAAVPAPDAAKSRQFSSFDMFPTILASIGAELPQGDGLAFGRNLFSGTPTILEEYGADRVNSELKKRILQFEELAH